MQNAFKYAIALLASLILTGTLLSATTAPASAVVYNPAKVIQHNLDGGPVTEAVAQANAMGANIMTLQELCRSQFDSLLVPNGGEWKAQGSWVTTKPASCADGSDEGQAILFRGPVGAEAFAYQVSLENPGDTDGLGPARGLTNRSGFSLTCFTNLTGVLGGSNPPKLRVCTTHLFTNGEAAGLDGNTVRGQQMSQIQAEIGKWVGGGSKVIFTGDLNMNPNSGNLDWVYNNFAEAGGNTRSAGGYTTTTDSGTKLDYVFGNKVPSLASKGLSAHPVGYSTHHVIRGTIGFQS